MIVSPLSRMTLSVCVVLICCVNQVLGLHGGGLYNILFAPATATIVEFLPTTPEGVAQAASHLVFWLLAMIHKQVYWRIPQVVDSSADVRDSISVDLTQLAQVLDHIFTPSSAASNGPMATTEATPSTLAGIYVAIPEKPIELQLAPSTAQLLEIREPTSSTKANEVAAASVMMIPADTTISREIVTHRTTLEWPLVEEYALEYPEFSLIEPNFLDPSHKRDFFQHRPPDDWYNLPPVARQGFITVVHKGLYNRSDDCGYRGDYRLHFPASNETLFQYMPGKVVALDDVPAKDFEHFMDSGMPKLLQAKRYLDANPDAIIMAHFSNNARIMELVRRLGVKHIVLPWQDPLAAEQLVLVCRTPPIHPILWQRARTLLGVQTDAVGTKVIWVVRNRSNARNGRICINDEQVQAYLRERFEVDFVSFDPNEHSLDETMQTFQQARVGKK